MKRRWSADKRTVAPVPDLEQLDELVKRFGTSLHSYRGEGRLGPALWERPRCQVCSGANCLTALTSS